MLRLRVALGLLLLALVPACKQPDSILLIEVSQVLGSTEIMAVQFRVNVTADVPNVTHAFLVPSAPMPSDHTIVYPASFTVALDGSQTGPITISIEAIDATGSPLASGTTTQHHIELGGQTIIPVALTDVLPPGGVDGGTDAAADAGTDVGGSGAGGAAGGGQGGAGGQGGTDGGDAAEVPSSLDAATD